MSRNRQEVPKMAYDPADCFDCGHGAGEHFDRKTDYDRAPCRKCPCPDFVLEEDL